MLRPGESRRNDTAALAAQLLSEATFQFHQPAYGLQLPQATSEVQLIRHVAGGDLCSGMIRGVVGNLLMLEATDRRVYVLPVKLLQGYLLRVERELVPLQLSHMPRAVRFET